MTRDSSVRVCDCFVGPGDSQQVRFDDPRVCKSFLLGCCPHEILASTVSRFVYLCHCQFKVIAKLSLMCQSFGTKFSARVVTVILV